MNFVQGKTVESRQRPNLFDFATKKLAQDAVIAHMMSWANPKNSHSILHALGIKLLKSLLKKP